MKRFYWFLIKTLICISLFLGLGILCKKDVYYKSYIQVKLYQDNFPFSSFKKFYDRYLGGVFPIDPVMNVQTTPVFFEKLTYSFKEDYEEGVSLRVLKNYLIPSQEKGIVVYIGEKDKYGNVVMIENELGIDVWYGGVCHPLVKLYDTIEKGSYIGEACGDDIYLVYTKENEYLDYHDYFFY